MTESERNFPTQEKVIIYFPRNFIVTTVNLSLRRISPIPVRTNYTDLRINSQISLIEEFINLFILLYIFSILVRVNEYLELILDPGNTRGKEGMHPGRDPSPL